MQSLKLYEFPNGRNHISGYSFGVKDAIPIVDPFHVSLKQLQVDYDTKGMKTTVFGILVVHDHDHPHLLALKLSDSQFTL
jgi:cleavage and polyadenylation specificity factor subunit 5